jgi:GcrA cell cycle regulator
MAASDPAAIEFRETLDALALTQDHAARLFNVDPRTIRRWGRGDRHLPSGLGLLLRLLRAGAVTVGQVEAVAGANRLDRAARADRLDRAAGTNRRDRAAGTNRRDRAARADQPKRAAGANRLDRAVTESALQAASVGAEADALAEEGPSVAEQVYRLGPRSCRWPIGDPQERSGFSFCSDPVVEKPYCTAHRARAFVPPQTPASGQRPSAGSPPRRQAPFDSRPLSGNPSGQ